MVMVAIELRCLTAPRSYATARVIPEKTHVGVTEKGKNSIEKKEDKARRWSTLRSGRLQKHGARQNSPV